MNHKAKIYSSVLIVVIFVFVLLFLVVFHLISNIKNNSKELINDKKELASVEYLTKSFKDFEKNFLLYEEGLKEMESLLSQESLIDPEIPIEFINFFKEKSSELELDLKITPIQEQVLGEDNWNYLKFRVTGTGRVDHIRNFFEKLENSKWLLSVEELSMISYQRGADDLLREYISINVTIKIYAQD